MYVAIPVATLATVAVHVAHVTMAVHVACAGIADGISIAADESVSALRIGTANSPRLVNRIITLFIPIVKSLSKD